MKKAFVAGVVVGQLCNFAAGCWLGYRILHEMHGE